MKRHFYNMFALLSFFLSFFFLFKKGDLGSRASPSREREKGEGGR